MLRDSRSEYFEIIREDVFDAEGKLIYENYVEEFEPYAVSKSHKKYANYGAIELIEFGIKSDNRYSNGKKDKKFEKRYRRIKEHLSHTVFGSTPLLETTVSDAMSYALLSPMLRNLTYGETMLSVWIDEGETYVLVYGGRGESACNLLFFCRIENP